jgi:hypothetical protein
MREIAPSSDEVLVWQVSAATGDATFAKRLMMAPSPTDVLPEVVALWRAAYPQARNVTVTVIPVASSVIDACESGAVEEARQAFGRGFYEVFYPKNWTPLRVAAAEDGTHLGSEPLTCAPRAHAAAAMPIQSDRRLSPV